MKSNLRNTNAFVLILISAFLLLNCGGGDSEGSVERALLEGRSAIDSKNYVVAINIFNESIKDHPSNRDLIYLLGVCYAKLDMIDSALVYLRKGKVLYPRDRDINKQLVFLCPLVGDDDGALKAVATLIATGDNERMYWRTLAELFYRTGNKILAIKYYRLIIAENPDWGTYYLSLSRTLAEMGNFKESNEILEKSIERFGPVSESCANLAVNYVNMKKYDKAEEYFRKSLAVDPDNIPVWINLAHVLVERETTKKKTEALEIYKKYYGITPKAFGLDSLIPALEAELKN